MNCEKLIPLSVLLLAGACATVRPTQYATQGGSESKEGLSIRELEGGQRSSLFVGNESSTTNRTYHYSKLGAIEHCFAQGQLTHLVNTVSEMVSAKGVASKPYPLSSTSFRCLPRMQLFQQEVELRPVPVPENLRGDGLGVIEVSEARGAGPFKTADLITHINGERVSDEAQLFAFYTQAGAKSARLKLWRGKELLALTVGLKDYSANLMRLNYFEAQKACAFTPKQEPSIKLCAVTPVQWEKQVKR